VTDIPPRTCYELLVNRHLSPATVASFAVALRPTAVPRNTVRRLRVGADSDIAEVVRRLTERNVELLGIRRFRQDPQRPVEQPATWAVPPEDDGSSVVVPLPMPRAAGPALPDHRSGEDGGASVTPLTGRGAGDGGGGGGRRRRRRPARG
jgi:hypothetical protein